MCITLPCCCLQDHPLVSVEVAALDWSDSGTYRYPHLGSGSVPQGHPPIAQSGNTTLEAAVAAQQEVEPSAATMHCGLGATEAKSMAQSGLLSPPLPLSHPQPQWDVVIGADVVWLEELVPLLVRALTALCGPETVLLLAHQKRSERTDALLFEGLSSDFVIEKVWCGVV